MYINNVSLFAPKETTVLFLRIITAVFENVPHANFSFLDFSQCISTLECCQTSHRDSFWWIANLGHTTDLLLCTGQCEMRGRKHHRLWFNFICMWLIFCFMCFHYLMRDVCLTLVYEYIVYCVQVYLLLDTSKLRIFNKFLNEIHTFVLWNYFSRTISRWVNIKGKHLVYLIQNKLNIKIFLNTFRVCPSWLNGTQT